MYLSCRSIMRWDKRWGWDQEVKGQEGSTQSITDNLDGRSQQPLLLRPYWLQSRWDQMHTYVWAPTDPGVLLQSRSTNGSETKHAVLLRCDMDVTLRSLVSSTLRSIKTAECKKNKNCKYISSKLARDHNFKDSEFHKSLSQSESFCRSVSNMLHFFVLFLLVVYESILFLKVAKVFHLCTTVNKTQK